MAQYLYDNFIIDLSKKVDRRLDEISAEYNFDLGDEFEIAICELLRDFLPSKYGICRGFVVDKNGNKAGDDIIIFDQERFPTLKFLSPNDFSRKENIPIEAVYCYLEAKYTLDLSSDVNSNFNKAIEQIHDIKEIVLTREKYELNKNDPYHYVKTPITSLSGIPPYRNPIFTMIISRYVSDGKKRIEPSSEINHLLNDKVKNILIDLNSPEAIVAGRDNYVSIAMRKIAKHPTIFVLPHESNEYVTIEKKGLCYGIGLTHLYYAIDWIRLDKMPWDEIFNDAKNN